MLNFKHGAKKRFNRNTTRSKTIQSGINSEFTELRRKLDAVASSVKSLTRLIKNTRTVWTAVAKHQKDFAEALVASVPTDGLVREHAQEVELLVRSVHPKFLEGDNAESADNKLLALLDAYLAQIDKVRKQYPTAETAYTETLRYQRKVDKLEAKGARKNAVLQRNMTKLNAAHADYETKLTALLALMRAEYDKHPAVLQVAHHAFWLAQHRYSATLDTVTRNIRAESVVAQHPLVRIDVSVAPRLTPVPRMRPASHIADAPLLPPAMEVLAIEEAPAAAADAVGGELNSGKDQFVDALPGTTKVEVVSEKAAKPLADEPSVPTEMPKAPAPREKAVPAAAAPAAVAG